MSTITYLSSYDNYYYFCLQISLISSSVPPSKSESLNGGSAHHVTIIRQHIIDIHIEDQHDITDSNPSVRGIQIRTRLTLHGHCDICYVTFQYEYKRLYTYGSVY